MTGRAPMHVIKGGLQGRLPRLIRTLIPSVKDSELRGGVCQTRNPTRADRNAGSFTIWLRGPGAGAWKDYRTDEKGDVIDLIAYCQGCARGDAIRWAEEFLGLGLVDAASLARMRAAKAEQERARETEQRRADARAVARAMAIWRAARPDVRGTPVETYLAGRGLPLDELPNLEWGELRYHPSLLWWLFERYERPPQEYPAMVWAVRDRGGALVAVHCTFLRPDGTGKAAVPKPKLVRGLAQGGVIRLTRGRWNLPPEQAPPGLLGLAEGVENGLTLGLAAPDARAWAALSLSNLGHAPIDHPCVSAVVVARDNDWGKPQAVAGFEAAIERLLGHGKPVEAMASHWGKDVNDALQR